MAERLTPTQEQPSTVDPETIAEIDSVENNLDQDTIDRLTEARERVARLMEELGPNPIDAPTEAPVDGAATTRELPTATTEHLTNPVDEDPLSQDEVYDTYANNIFYTAEKERLIDPRSRLRKIGDSVLRLQERIGKSTPAKLLARWGIIPPIGTRHTQRGLNFSAMIARRYVKAQEARESREARISAGFLSAEDQAYLDSIDETTPEKIAQDAAYDTYQDNINATAERERQEAAKRAAQEQAFDSYADNIDATAKREARETQDEAYASYADNLAETAEREKREQAEKDAQREAFESYAENIDTTAKREAQEQAFDSYADNIDTTAKRESQEVAYESYESNIEATAERERQEAHDRATKAAADRDQRHERRPVSEHVANLKERFSHLKGRIGSNAIKLFSRTKVGLKTAAGAFRRDR